MVDVDREIVLFANERKELSFASNKFEVQMPLEGIGDARPHPGLRNDNYV